MAAIGKATTVKKPFSRESTVSTLVQAQSDVIWELLTNISDMPKWNSTIVSLQGNIKLGETIKLKSTLDEKRTFKLKIKELELQKRLVWGDSQGSRTYTLTSSSDDTTTFTMIEKIGGFLFPLYGRFIPSFDASFEQFATDLKKEAEHRQKSTIK